MSAVTTVILAAVSKTTFSSRSDEYSIRRNASGDLHLPFLYGKAQKNAAMQCMELILDGN